MCHLRQKSEKPLAAYGNLKFCGSVNPKHMATPMAQVEYPAKSKNICPEKASTPIHASSGSKLLCAVNTVSTGPAKNVSAITTFINKPSESKNNPFSSCS